MTRTTVNPWADAPSDETTDGPPPRAKPERHAFTENYLRNLRPRPARYSVFCSESPGLGMRVYPSGKRVWVAQAVPKGSARQVLVTLGRWPGVRLPAARKLAEEAFAEIARGKNPNVQADQRAADTFRVMVEQYVSTELAGKRRGREVATTLRSDWLGQVPTRTKVMRPGGRVSWETVWADGPARILRDRPVAMIEKTELLGRLDKIRSERGEWAARHAMAAVRAVFAWAAADGRFGLQVSPAAGLRDRTVGLTAQAMRRQRVLSDSEIRSIWHAAGGCGLYGRLVRLILLTGQRRSDWDRAQWGEIDGPLLTVPAVRFKTGRSHEVPLTPEVLELLEELPRHKTCPWVFSRDGRRPAQDYTDEKAELLKVSGTAGWHLHDLRRTVRTRLSVLRVPRDTAERVIGHEIGGGLDAVYDLSSHLDAKRDALTAWALALRAIVSPPDQPVGIGGNVVALRRAG